MEKKFFWLLPNLIAIKTAMAVLLTYVICDYLGATMLDRCWATLTVFVVMGSRLGATISASWNRLLGTVIGALLSASLLMILPTHNFYMQLLGLLIISVVCARLFEWRSTLRIAGATATIIYVVGLSEVNPWTLTLERFSYILLGTFIPLLISLLIFPSRSKEIFINKIVASFTLSAELIQTLLANYIQGSTPSSETLAQLQHIKLKLREYRDLIAEADHEAWGNAQQMQKLNTLIETQSTLYHGLLTLADTAKQQSGKAIAHSVAEKLQQVAHNIRDFLTAYIDAIQTNKPVSGKETLGAATALIDAEFSKMRRAKTFVTHTNDAVLSWYTLLFELNSIIDCLKTLENV